MNRERWTSFPATTDGELGLLRAMSRAAAPREVAVVAADGTERPVAAALSIEAAEPLDGRADVVVRLTLDADALRDGERLAGDPWDLMDRFLRESESQARRTAAEPR